MAVNEGKKHIVEIEEGEGIKQRRGEQLVMVIAGKEGQITTRVSSPAMTSLLC